MAPADRRSRTPPWSAESAAGRQRPLSAWLGRLTTEQPNLRAALAHSITTGDIESAWRSVATLQRFWELTGQRREAREWIQRALAISDPPATPAAVAGLAAASMILHPSDTRAAFELPSKRRGSLPIWTTSPAPRRRSRSG